MSSARPMMDRQIGRCCSERGQDPSSARGMPLHSSDSLRLYSSEPPQANSEGKKRDVVDVTRTKKRVKANAVFLIIPH